MSSPESPAQSFEPRLPTGLAVLIFVLAALTLCWPMLGGRFLVGPLSDQLGAGYGFRAYGAEYFRAAGSIPEWNPYIFGGLPFIAAMHGDIFYPTAWLRWVMPVDTAMNLGFAIHIVLAGCFMYAFLRALRLGWTASVIGGLAYELTGMVASLVQPGHDGKLYVSALAPLAFLALVRAVRDDQMWGYGLLALTVGLCLLSPHFQLTYYLLVAAAIWALYLVFFDGERRPGLRWSIPLGASFAAVLLGLAIAALQVLPFLAYLPYSPRAAGGPSGGWEYATSYSMPVEELFTTVLPHFNGVLEQYWGQNFFKLHTEYLGATIVLLAVFGWGAREWRRLLRPFGIIGLLMLLISLGGHTPFYRLWYEVMPLMKKVRAPGMAFVFVAFPVAVCAAVGAERLLRREVPLRTIGIASAVLGGIALLGTVGILQSVAELIAGPQQMERVLANAGPLRLGALRLLLVVLAAAGAFWGVRTGRLRGAGAAAVLALVVTGDLWSIDRRFFTYSLPAATLYGSDPLLAALGRVPKPFRVLDLPGRAGVYDVSWLMPHHIQSVLGYHGNEVRFYDELWGGKNEWRNLGSTNLWDLFAVRFLLLREPQTVPGLHRILGPVQTVRGDSALLYERDTMPPYVRVVAAAAKIPEDQVVTTVTDPRFPVSKIAIYSDTISIDPAPLEGGQLPPPSPVHASLAAWAPGRMSVTLSGTDRRPTYLLVGETWYPDWHALIDGRPAPVHRADHALLSVVVPPGAREVRLTFWSPAYRRGRWISFAALVAAAGLIAVPFVRRQRGARA